MNKREIMCISVLALGVEWCMICDEGSAMYGHIIPLRWPTDSDKVPSLLQQEQYCNSNKKRIKIEQYRTIHTFN